LKLDNFFVFHEYVGAKLREIKAIGLKNFQVGRPTVQNQDVISFSHVLSYQFQYIFFYINITHAFFVIYYNIFEGWMCKPCIKGDKSLANSETIIEPHHDKTNIMGLRPAWIQTSLRIRASMLFAISFSTCYRICKRTAWILIRLRRYAGWSGSMLVTNPLCWFCHDAAHIIIDHFHKLFIWCMIFFFARPFIYIYNYPV
jgi:hypothetical protein